MIQHNAMRVRVALLLAAFVFLPLASVRADGPRSIFDTDTPGSSRPSPKPDNRPPATVTPPAPAPQTPQPAQPSERLPVPDAAALASAQAMVRELFKLDYARTSAADRAALAHKLLDQAERVSDDAAGRYALLTEAAACAAAAGDVELAMATAQRVGRQYKVNSLELEAATLITASAATVAGEQSARIVHESLRLINLASAADDYATADSLLSVAKAAAAHASDMRLVTEVDNAGRSIASAEGTFHGIQPALTRLATSPTDPAANLVAGRYYCLIRGDWERGLPYLAKSGVDALSAPAAAELANPATADARAEVAGAWWSASNAEAEPAKGAMKRHASDLYSKALPDLSGLNKRLAEKRIAEAPAAPDAPVAVRTPSVPAAPSAPGAPMAPELPPAIAMGSLQPGLVGELFSDNDFKQKVKVRIDRQIYFDFGKLGPDPSMKGGVFSIRWTGSIQVPTTGKYTFVAGLDDGLRIWIDDKLIFERTQASWDERENVSLAAGLHSIRIDYWNTGGEGRVRLKWSLEGGFPPQQPQREVLWHPSPVAGGAEPAPRGWRTDVISGKRGSGPYIEYAPTGSVLVGFNFTIKNFLSHLQIKSLQAVYGGNGSQTLGERHGKPEGDPVQVLAKPGYAIGNVTARSGDGIDAVQITFMRLNGSTLDASDSYTSDWIGGPGGKETAPLMSDARPLIGIYGNAKGSVDGLGFIQKD